MVENKVEKKVENKFENSYKVSEIEQFEQKDFFVWKIENLSAYTLYSFRVSVILSDKFSDNFPDSILMIDSEPSRVVRTGLSESVSTPPLFRGIQQVLKLN